MMLPCLLQEKIDGTLKRWPIFSDLEGQVIFREI